MAFRNGNFVAPDYTVLGGKIYDTKTGALLEENQAAEQKVAQEQNQVKTALSLSDKLNQENLLRFYVPNGFTTIDPAKYDYKNQVQRNQQIEKEKGAASTSVYSKNHDQTTTNLYPAEDGSADKP